MKRAIATLLAVVIIAAVINVAVFAATLSITHVKAQQQTSLTVTYYPKEAIRGEYFNVAGTLTSAEPVRAVK